MSVLLLREDADGSRSWGTYHITPDSRGWEWDELFDDLKSHLNTEGVTEIRLITGEGQ